MSTEIFSQHLFVTDSDITDITDSNSVISLDKSSTIDFTNPLDPRSNFHSSVNNLNRSISKEQLLSQGKNKLVESDSSPSLKCSTLNNQSAKNSLLEERLHRFFASIPEPGIETRSECISNTESSRAQCLDSSNDEINQSMSIYEKQNRVTDRTESSISDNYISDDNDVQDEQSIIHEPTAGTRHVNISAKINIKIHIAETDSETEEVDGEDIRTISQNKNINVQQTIPIRSHKVLPIIDENMRQILDELYGNSWRTDELVELCTAFSKTKLDKTKECEETNNEKLPFLKCLDEQISVQSCDKSTQKYRLQFHKYKDELLHKLYNLFNSKVFRNSLDVPVVWNTRLLTTAGRCKNMNRNHVRTSKIELSKKVINNAERMRCTLIHEMCHAAAWIFNNENGHRKSWKKWTRRANKVFPELPIITVCHQYEIDYKYTYQCVLCKEKYSTNQRSKDEDRIRCAQCYGSIELIVNR